MNAMTIAIALWATFLVGMVVGLGLMLLSVLVRKRGSVLGARLLVTGPAGGLLAGALFLLGTALPPVEKTALVGLFAITGAATFAALLRTRLAFRDVRFS